MIQQSAGSLVPASCQLLLKIHNLLNLNGQLYAIGGNTGCGAPMRAVEAYNPASNSWSSKALLPTASWGLGAASANGKIYVNTSPKRFFRLTQP